MVIEDIANAHGGLQVPDEIEAKAAAHLFIGRTIEAMDATCCNQIEFRFTDGGKAVLHIECGGSGLPDVLVCTHCATAV